MKTIKTEKYKGRTFKYVVPETEEEKKEIEKIIEEVKKEKVDMSKFKLVGPDDDEDEIFRDSE